MMSHGHDALTQHTTHTKIVIRQQHCHHGKDNLLLISKVRITRVDQMFQDGKCGGAGFVVSRLQLQLKEVHDAFGETWSEDLKTSHQFVVVFH